MDEKSIQTRLAEFGRRYFQADIFETYPEAKIIPAYLKEHFSNAEIVLDLGFGTGLWFWASFLPALKRLDGLDGYPEALSEAERVFTLPEVPEGYRAAHARLGEDFTRRELQELQNKRGALVIQDYRAPWPEEIMNTRYDLVTEHGGGLGDLCSKEEFINVVSKAAEVLKPSGQILFVNFQFERASRWKDCPGRNASGALPLDAELYAQAAERAGMRLVDFHTVDRPEDMPEVSAWFYGYAQKM